MVISAKKEEAINMDYLKVVLLWPLHSALLPHPLSPEIADSIL